MPARTRREQHRQTFYQHPIKQQIPLKKKEEKMVKCSVREEEEGEEGGRGGGGGCQHELTAPYSYASVECTQSCSCETCTHMYLYPESQVTSLSELRWWGPIACSRGRKTTLLTWNSISFGYIDLHKQAGWRQGSYRTIFFSLSLFPAGSGKGLIEEKVGEFMRCSFFFRSINNLTGCLCRHTGERLV